MENDDDEFDELERLLQRALDGDTQALGNLLERDRDRQKQLANQTLPAALRGRIDGSDVAQRVQCAALEGFCNFRGATVAQFREWCRGILEHDILRILEREKYTAKRSVDREEDAPGQIAQAAGQQTSPSQRAVLHEHQTILLEAIDALEPLVGEVMKLKHLQDVTLERIVEQTGLSKRDVCKLLEQGMRTLKTYLKQRGLGDH